jgi:MYXO-CTERM domain-containing protein
MKRILSAAALGLIAATSVFAGPIAGLVNTGTGAAGSLESAYTLTVEEGATVLTNTHPYVTTGDQWPINPWTANSAISKWVTPTANQGETFDPLSDGVYRFSLSFNLASTAYSTAAFTGRFSADNAAIVYLNGQAVGSSSGFEAWNSFAASSGFVAGANTLDFIVRNYAQNSGNPLGLRVEFLSSGVSAVPEADSWLMLTAGLGLLGFTARRRKA